MREIPEKHQAMIFASLQSERSRQIPFVDPHYYEVDSWFSGDIRKPNSLLFAQNPRLNQVPGYVRGLITDENMYGTVESASLQKFETPAIATGCDNTSFGSLDNAFLGYTSMAQDCAPSVFPMKGQMYRPTASATQDYVHRPTVTQTQEFVHQPIVQVPQQDKQRDYSITKIPELYTKEQVIQMMEAFSDLHMRGGTKNQEELIAAALKEPQPTTLSVCCTLPSLQGLISNNYRYSRRMKSQSWKRKLEGSR